jgi:HSF-type DNA-binding
VLFLFAPFHFHYFSFLASHQQPPVSPCRNKRIEHTMCVTNTTYRRSQPISLTDAQQQQQPGAFASGLTQRLSAAAASQQQQQNARFFSAMPQLSAEFSIAPPTEKPRPKRRRKPQKPGKTAKMNDRHFVVHSYHDHSNDPVDSSGAAADEDHFHLSKCTSAAQHEEDYYEPSQQQHRRKGGVAIAFPLKLHAVLDQVEADGLSHVISWMPHGRCFVIHQPKEFVDHVLPK